MAENRIELTTEEVKNRELEMLAYIDKVCRENNIKYFVCGGTLIGAVRHHGFIPWDDDIDINMPRPDYEKLKKIINNERYMLISDQDDCYFTFGKLVDTETVLIEHRCKNQINGMGIYIDIFPLDGLPKGKRAAFKEFKKLLSLNDILRYFGFGKPPYRRNFIKLFISRVKWMSEKNHSITWWRHKYMQQALKYNFYESDLVCSAGGGYALKEIYPRRFFDKSRRCKFENIEVNIPEGYDEFLTLMYGNYMKLPPKETQVTNHNFTVYKKR